MRISKEPFTSSPIRIGSPGTASQKIVANILSPVHTLDQFATDLVLGILLAIDNNHSNQTIMCKSVWPQH